MKKLTSDINWYGPFEEILTTEDSYVGDGVVFPFTVVGTCTISDYDPAVDVRPVEEPAPTKNPTKEELLAELAALTAKIQALE